MTDTDLGEHRYIKRREAERFWQFQFEREPFKETKAFYDKDFGTKAASLDAARSHREEFFKSAAELGFVGPDGSFVIDPIPIQLALLKNSSRCERAASSEAALVPKSLS